MTDFLPRTFFEVMGGVLCLAALLFSGISLFEKVRVHSLRVLAIFVVAALALFGNHISVYFAAVFIIATAVTELEFLQTLAAIIRGNKEYFTYKTGTMSYEEKIRLLKAEWNQFGGSEKKPENAANDDVEVVRPGFVPAPDESEVREDNTKKPSGSVEIPNVVEEASAPYYATARDSSSSEDVDKVTSTEPIPVPTSNHVSTKGRATGIMVTNRILKKILMVESMALDYVESMYGLPIQRDVLLKSAEHELALDGLMRFPESTRQPEEIFEVVYLPKLGSTGRLHDAVYKLSAKAARFASITKRVPNSQLIIVLSEGATLSQKQIDRLNHAIQVTGVNGYHVLNEEELNIIPSFWNE
jgi:hypothetical protein